MIFEKPEIRLEEYASFVIREIFGSAEVKVKQVTRGVMTFKFAALLPTGEQYLVRFYPPSRSAVVAYEPDILHRCSEAGLPVPEVVADSRTGPPTPLQYMVYKIIKGVPLSERFPGLTTESQEEIAEQLVTCLCMLQQIPIIGYGDLTDGIRAQFGSWQAFIQRSFTEGISVAKQYNLLTSKMITNLKIAARELEQFPVQRPSGLAWGDISPDNILIGPHRRSIGLLDFEGVLAADILLNLGYCYARYHETDFFKSIVCAWPNRLTNDHWRKIELYAILRALRIFKYAHQPLPTGHPRTPIEQLLPGFQSALKKLSKR